MNFIVNDSECLGADTSVVLHAPDATATYPAEVAELLEYAKSARGFTGAFSETVTLDVPGKSGIGRYVFAGRGDAPANTHDPVRKLYSVVAKQLKSAKASRVVVSFDFLSGEGESQAYLYILSAIESLALSLYQYDKYLSKKKAPTVDTFFLVVPEALVGVAERARDEAVVLVAATNAARDLVNEPSNIQSPQKLSEQAKELCEGLPIECSVYDEKQMEEWGMKAVLAVGQASPNRPRLIVMRYKGDPSSDQIVGLVGKGLTFDSGGLSLKHKSRLPHMKHDMAGAAAVIGAITAIARRGLKVNVTAVVATVDNLLSGTGYKPGDIIGSMGGKSILIISTDGEGRLTLADAITYAVRKEDISCVYDIATLTGGARAIFGGYINPVLSNSDKHFEALQKASMITGERVHRFPLMSEARALLDCDIADLRNSTDKPYLRMQQGGMFVYEFVGDFPWVHTDISGAGMFDFDIDYNPAGGTGRGVRNLYHCARILAGEE